jgi:hypothetical protein
VVFSSTAFLGVLVGLGAGGGAIAFRYVILWFTEGFSGTSDYSPAGRVANPHVPWLGIGFVVVEPMVGGLLYGPLIARFAPEARGQGVPEVMLSVAERGGRIGARVAIVKSLASALCIGSGGSVGREGPIVQIGVCARFDDRPGFSRAAGSSAVACRLRRGWRHLRDVQRADRGSDVLARAYPAQLRGRAVRGRGARVRCG